MSALAEVTKPAAQSTDDLDLVAAVRAGDDRAFELLFARYQIRITAYVRGMVRDHGRAEDITQEVFIAALRRMRETDREIAFKPWIYEIAKNACIDAFRRTRHTSEVSLDAEDALGPSDHGRLTAPGGAPDDAVATKLSIDNLCGAFGGLSQQHHDILVMREFEGLSYREIGERLGMSRAGVESTLFRARRRLSEEYEELVSGERCLRVRVIADAAGGRVVGLRDRRRLARHVSHCQPCRRYALAAGVDVAAVRAPAAVASKVAALLPLPSFLRRRLDPEHVLSVHSSPALNVVAAIDPATVSAWSKAVATAATVAVAGLGAGAAVKHDAVGDLFSRTPSIVGQAPDGSAAERGQARRQALRQTAKLVRGKRSAPEVDMQRAGGGTHESSGTMIGPEAREGTPDAGDSPLASSTESPSSASDPPGSAAGEPAGSPAAEGAIASPGSAGLSDAAKGVLDSESPTVAALTDEPTDGGQTSLQPANTVTNGLHTLVGDATGIAENAIGSDTSPLAKPDLPLPDLGDLSVENVIGETLFDRPLVSRPNDGAPAAPAGEGASADDDRPGPSPGLGGGVGDEPGAGADGRGADAAGGARRGEGADGVGGARRGEGADAAGGVGRGQGAGGAGGATHTHGADAADGTGRSEGAARVLDAIALRDVVVAGKPDSPASADAGVSEAPIGRQAAARALEALMRHDFVGAAAAAGLDLQDIRRDGGVIVAQRPDVAAALQGDPATVRAAGEMIVAVLVARALRDPTAGRS